MFVTSFHYDTYSNQDKFETEEEAILHLLKLYENEARYIDCDLDYVLEEWNENFPERLEDWEHIFVDILDQPSPTHNILVV